MQSLMGETPKTALHRFHARCPFHGKMPIPRKMPILQVRPVANLILNGSYASQAQSPPY
ncbi:MAG: hypothetical protein F6J98_29600 [Moorea sp. SIO4G2]|uniref:hypothetical protein n=1 Tax=unclassified Moorena TaxID=2683338 RepID=UPI0013FAB15C|nr:MULTISPECIES: hypothetical protein [unclassified Moorena]NEO12933.1 hypothetical protein [Moorena sp. SIO3E8]NEO64336.1 hypothetical protein [Moorena sp. SIO4G2]NEP99897.1 hypothetical protein [Moorena sp. SIO3F7]